MKKNISLALATAIMAFVTLFACSSDTHEEIRIVNGERVDLAALGPTFVCNDVNACERGSEVCVLETYEYSSKVEKSSCVDISAVAHDCDTVFDDVIKEKFDYDQGRHCFISSEKKEMEIRIWNLGDLPVANSVTDFVKNEGTIQFPNNEANEFTNSYIKDGEFFGTPVGSSPSCSIASRGFLNSNAHIITESEERVFGQQRILTFNLSEFAVVECSKDPLDPTPFSIDELKLIFGDTAVFAEGN